jgi:hypothetical protein
MSPESWYLRVQTARPSEYFSFPEFSPLGRCIPRTYESRKASAVTQALSPTRSFETSLSSTSSRTRRTACLGSVAILSRALAAEESQPQPQQDSSIRLSFPEFPISFCQISSLYRFTAIACSSKWPPINSDPAPMNSLAG